jgi:LemA protein
LKTARLARHQSRWRSPAHKEKENMRKLLWALAGFAALTLSGCGYNDFQTKDEQVKAAWSEVLNQYKRRADLIPNLVSTVQGYAAQEKDVLIGVTNARARATSVTLPADALSDPAKVKQFQAAQGELSGALGRLLVVAENYPQLKSDQNFRDLQAQLEGTENRITTARNRIIKAVQEYNILARQFPTNLTAMLFSYKQKASFEVENEKAIAEPPKVDFAPKAAPAVPPGAAPTTPAAPTPAPAGK